VNHKEVGLMTRLSELPVTTIKLNNKRMSEQIFEQLCDWIMDGTLRAGQKISEDELADRFGVSRMPVREAVRLLSAKGLVESIPYIGTTVRVLTDHEVREIYLLRSVLEPLASSKAAEYIIDVELEQLQNIQTELEKNAKLPLSLSTSKELYRLNKEFHMCMYAPSRMNTLLKIIDGLWDSIANIRMRIAYTSIYPQQMQHEHRDYIHCLKQRDGETLAQIVKKNLEFHAKQIPSIDKLFEMDQALHQ